MIVLLKPKKQTLTTTRKHNSALQKKKKRKKSQSGTFSGQLNNTGIYNMDGIDKIIIIIGIIKLDFYLQNKKKRKTSLRYHDG